jgi:hypothetical protein
VVAVVANTTVAGEQVEQVVVVEVEPLELPL